MTERDGRIVKWSRLYGMLADRNEYMSRDRARRVAALDRKVAGFVSPIDAESIEDAAEIDRLCGAAVRLLRRGTSAGVVDLLGWLDPDRLAAVALALPDDRRARLVNRDPIWGRAWRSIDPDAVREAEAMIAEFDAAWRRYDDHVRTLGLLPEELTDEARREAAGVDG